MSIIKSMGVLNQTLRPVFGLATCLNSLAAEEVGATSANFSVPHHTVASGGGMSISQRFEIVSSINSIVTAGIGNSQSFTDRRGYIGQLNESPLAQPDQAIVPPGRPLKILTTELLRNDTDAEDDAIQFISLPAISANGVPLSRIGAWILYDSGPNNTLNDSFTYTVFDGLDSSEGVVNVIVLTPEAITLNIGITVTGGEAIVRIYGIPGHTYQLQVTDQLASPIVWANIGAPKVAPTNGLIVEELDEASSSHRFFRAIEP